MVVHTNCLQRKQWEVSTEMAGRLLHLETRSQLSEDYVEGSCNNVVFYFSRGYVSGKPKEMKRF